MTTKNEVPKHPTLERIILIRPQAEAVGQFLDWLTEQGITLCAYHEYRKEECPDCKNRSRSRGRRRGEDGCTTCGGWGYISDPKGFLPITKGIQALLHDFFEIDPVAEENEKRALLDYLS